MDPTKVRAVTSWPPSHNLKELCGFLGFANFYRRFIRDFARVARPLNVLIENVKGLQNPEGMVQG